MPSLLKAACLSASVVACAALGGCDALTGQAMEICSLGPADSAVTVSLKPADCERVQSAFAQQGMRQAQAAQAGAQVEQQQAVRKYRAEVTARMRKDEQNGYRSTSVENFKLYGDQLAQSDARVAVPGVYLRTNRGEFLLPSTLATSQVEPAETPDQGINLMSKNANHVTKQALDRCQKDPVTARLGCPITILGEAVRCERTTIFGMAEAPCIAVDDSWYIAPPG